MARLDAREPAKLSTASNASSSTLFTGSVPKRFQPPRYDFRHFYRQARHSALPTSYRQKARETCRNRHLSQGLYNWYSTDQRSHVHFPQSQPRWVRTTALYAPCTAAVCTASGSSALLRRPAASAILCAASSGE